MPYLYVEEVSVLELAEENPLAGHKWCGGKWKACGDEHAIVIESLRHTKDGWKLERSGHSGLLLCVNWNGCKGDVNHKQEVIWN